MKALSPLLVTIPRRDDPTGHGDYGMPRGTRKHKGFDLLADPGTDVCLPMDGFITKIGYPYVGDMVLRYIEITNHTYRWRLYYCKPIKGLQVNDRMNRGDKCGIVQNVSKKHGGQMLNHIHIELYKNGLLTDPEPLLL